MNDSISRQALYAQIMGLQVHTMMLRDGKPHGMVDIDAVFDAIEKAPSAFGAIEKAPTAAGGGAVRHGRWIDGRPYTNSRWKVCSVCKESAPEPNGGYAYCAECGAKMDGDEA